ncbi:glyoxylate reductase/hydroxypyruvate reductase-like isoform X1 [Temnothorax longispinosus]|uniref:glyoxylate reductase/hydroxypyruvate reductase-like isoform X1 n=1 Tax=Temnothorax longispinosus TaxID=300112 RepID=UPI003A99EE53
MSSPAQQWKVLVDHKDVPQPGIKLLEDNNCEITILENYNADVYRQKILAALREQSFDAVFLAPCSSSHVKVDKEFLDAAGKNLKVISTMTSGYDHLDLTLIKERGIKAGHAPKVLSAAVAEMAVLLLLSAARRARESRKKLENCERSTGPQWLLGRDLRGSTVGIFGLGNIGQEIVKRLKAFEVGKFIYTGPSRKREDEELGAEYVSWDKLLEQSDFLVISAPLTSKTRKLFDDDAFEKMKKKKPVFVNVARGEIVDTAALQRALCKMKIFAAGLDVTDPEPLPRKHELLKLRNVEILPHLGSSTIKTRDDMAKVAALNIINVLAGKDLEYAIPLP